MGRLLGSLGIILLFIIASGCGGGKGLTAYDGSCPGHLKKKKSLQGDFVYTSQRENTIRRQRGSQKSALSSTRKKYRGKQKVKNTIKVYWNN